MSNTSKFKVGDRVRGLTADYEVKGKLGTVEKVKEDASGSMLGVAFDDNVNGHTIDGLARSGHGWWLYDNDIERAATLDSLSVGDVVVDDDGDEYTVIGVDGLVIHLADANGHMYDSITPKELRDKDYTVKGAEPEDSQEYTLQEIADSLKIDVSKLRIKE